MAKGSNFEREVSKELSLWTTNGVRDDIYWRSSQSGGRATIRARQGKKTANSAGDICFIDPIGKPLLDIFVLELKNGYGGKKSLNRQKIKDYVSDLVHYNTSDKRQKKRIHEIALKTLTDKQKAAWFKKKGGFDYTEFINIMIFKEIEKSKNDGKISVLDILDSNLKNKILIDWAIKLSGETREHGRVSWMLIFKRDNRKKCVMIESKMFHILCEDQNDNSILIKKYIKMNTCIDDVNEVYIFDYVDFFNWLKFGTLEKTLGRIK